MHISVIIPVYQRPEQLLRAVQSVLAQSYQDFELIVIDDGSTADYSAVRSLFNKTKHRLINISRGGVARARNFGISQAQHDWIAFLDSDDTWLPTKLTQQVAFHQQDSARLISQTQEIWYRNAVRVNPKHYHAQPNGEAFLACLDRCVVSASSVLIARQVLDEVGIFDPQMTVCEDYDLWLRVAAHFPIFLVNDFLVEKFAGHHDQLSKIEPVMDRYRIFALLKLIQQPALSREYYQATKAVLLNKLQILKAGAEKRKNTQVEVYRALIEQVEANNMAYYPEALAALVKGFTAASAVYSH